MDELVGRGSINHQWGAWYVGCFFISNNWLRTSWVSWLPGGLFKKMPIISNMFFEETQASRKHRKPSQADAQLATVPPSRRRGCEPNETRGSFSWAKARRFWSWKIMVSSLDLSYNIWNSEAEILFWRWSSISHWTCSTPGPSFSFEDVLMQIELRSWDTTPAVLRHLN